MKFEGGAITGAETTRHEVTPLRSPLSGGRGGGGFFSGTHQLRYEPWCAENAVGRRIFVIELFRGLFFEASYQLRFHLIYSISR